MPHKIAVGLVLLFFVTWQSIRSAHGEPYEILVDSDIDTDDFFALLYLLKQNRSEFNLKGITINANTWSDAGHAVNHVYDILYMMGRDDIPVGIGGEGGILYNGTILPNVGGYLPLIEQGLSTMGGCRYRQSIPPGPGGRLDIDTNYGVRRELLPQGKRRYLPLVQPTAQEVMVKALSSGPTIVLLIGAHTNFALFLMTHPHLKKNVEHIYIMGGGVRSRNPKGCCAVNASASCTPTQCGDRGNIFTGYHSDPFAEFNIFGDPFAAYQVFHSGIPITLVPLDATNTILISKEFFTAFERNRKTYEAQYIFESLKLVRDTWYDDLFYTSYFMWDSFMSGVTISSIRNGHLNSDANEFAELKYINVTVVTSNKPYGIRDYSNPFFDDRKVPKFNLKKGGVHSGHVITDLEDPSCFVPMGNGKCQDGYTKEVAGSEGVQILVATKAKANPDRKSRLNRAFYIDFLKVLNSPFQTAKFNLRTEFPYYKEVHYLPNFGGKKRGTPIIFDMDISPGDIITLLYLLKMPIELIDLKAITVNGNGWTNAATIDIIYDILHMMGRDDIAVGLGDFFALNQSYSFSSAVGNCKYSKAIPYGSGGLIDTDTLFGLARDLPRSPRRYTAHDSVKFGAIRNTEHPELRQPKAIEIWQNISSNLESGSKVTILAAGPLTNIAKMVNSTTSSKIEHIYIVGGTAEGTEQGKGKGNGNVFSVKVNKGAELNFFLDPLAASQVIEQAHAKFNVTVVPLSVQRNVSSLRALRTALIKSKFSKKESSSSSSTGEAAFVLRLVSKMLRLSAKRQFYRHLDMFVGEVIGGAMIMQEQRRRVGVETQAAASWPWPWPSVSATGHVATDGIDNINIDNANANNNGSCVFSSSFPCCCVQVVTNIHPSAFYHDIAFWLHKRSNQSALIPDFSAQVKVWNTPPAPAPASAADN